MTMDTAIATAVSNAGTSQFPVVGRVVLISSNTSLGAANTFIMRAARDVAGALFAGSGDWSMRGGWSMKTRVITDCGTV